jgi:hypothetical protein
MLQLARDVAIEMPRFKGPTAARGAVLATERYDVRVV